MVALPQNMALVKAMHLQVLYRFNTQAIMMFHKFSISKDHKRHLVSHVEKILIDYLYLVKL